jgi:hypothetical protein
MRWAGHVALMGRRRRRRRKRKRDDDDDDERSVQYMKMSS